MECVDFAAVLPSGCFKHTIWWIGSTKSPPTCVFWSSQAIYKKSPNFYVGHPLKNFGTVFNKLFAFWKASRVAWNGNMNNQIEQKKCIVT